MKNVLSGDKGPLFWNDTLPPEALRGSLFVVNAHTESWEIKSFPESESFRVSPAIVDFQGFSSAENC